MKEIWKDIHGYEGHYLVSNLGNVKSLNYQGKIGCERNLVPKKNSRDYLWVILYKCGSKKPILIHRLVAEAFIENPNDYPVINHKDENKLNNNAENLEWCTRSYNVKYSIDRHPERSTKGIPRMSYKYKDNGKKEARTGRKIHQYTLDGRFVKEWKNSVTIKRETGMSDWSISECCRGNRKKAYGFRWQYAI